MSGREPMWRRYLRFHRPDPVADLDDELRDHLDSTREALIAQGLTPGDAAAEALRRFGDATRVRQTVARMDLQHQRRSWWATAVDAFVQDTVFATRVFRHSPGFTLIAAVSIGLSIAANSTVFSVVNAVLFRPIPGATSDGLVRVYVNHHSPFTWHDLSWFRERSTSFSHIVGERYGVMAFQAGASDRTERVRTSLVTRGFFPALGVRMALGRSFDIDERSAEATQIVAVLSYQLWQRRFGGDSSVVGRSVSIAGHPVTVVGVLAPPFRSSVVGWTPEVLLPFAAAPLLTGTALDDFGGSLYTTARLARGVNPAAAGAELHVLLSQLARTDSARYDRMTVRLDHSRGVNAELRMATAAGSAFVMAMVGFVLLIACVNVANLLLGRAAARQTEIGVRLALGASRRRIVRQLLTESLLLAVLGGALGLAATFGLTRVLAAAVPAEVGIDGTFFAPDRRVLLFTAAMCLVTTLLFGLLPALRAASPRVLPMIKAEQPQGRQRRRGGLLAAQAALCVVLLAVGSLFWRSLESIRALDTGFRTTNVVDVVVDLSLVPGDDDTRAAQLERILERTRALPGVESAALAALVPLAGSNMETRVAPDGMTAATRFDYPSTYFNVVTPGYLQTLAIPLQGGRDFDATDRATTARVAIINETAAKRWWPNQSAVGKHFRWGGVDGVPTEVIGVARDADYNMAGEARKAFVYLPLSQNGRSEMVLQLHTATAPGTVRDAVWQLLAAKAPTLPPAPVTTIADDMALTLFPVRTGATLLTVLGAIALLLAATGIYGVTSYAVARRTREIGIRAALGAGRQGLLGLVVAESLRPVSVGIGVGLLLSLGLAAGLGRVLYGVHPLDPVVLPGTALVIIIVSVAATLRPAWRAASINPVIAMRSE